jgi:ATP-dependent DNA helicase RecG
VTANDVDAVLAAPLDEVGARLVAIAEDQWFERKSIRIQAKDLGRPLTWNGKSARDPRAYWTLHET